jgi:hypothetical protein
MTRPDLPMAEAAEGRFADAINYLRLGWAILQEPKESASESMTTGDGSQVRFKEVEPCHFVKV